ncbi:MAG: hypothetical protein A2X12_11885 [Bacteroidetes bacterium GWE2_29_8]|nr:MAG: hypothetical protein A2X12_11885 [Bacteroidetes bacterium GWE2_29_8]OFY22159.1 MAG: hypothetical protein A2X02_00350 [Bacteroidetes bacterium GWF2_29_10]
MANYTDNLNNKVEQIPEEEIDVKKYLTIFINNWNLFAVSIFAFFIVAYLYIKYANEINKNTITILVQDDKKNPYGFSPSDFLGADDLFRDGKNIQNEIGILKSYELSYQTVVNLGWNIGYYKKTKFLRNIELYIKNPYEVKIDSSKWQMVDMNFYIDIISDKEYRLSFESDEKNIILYNYSDNSNKIIKGNIEFSKKYKFGEPVNEYFGTFVIYLLNNNLNDEKSKDNNIKYYFNFFSPDKIVKSISSNLDISYENKESTILNISLKGNNTIKITDFLNKFVEVYINNNLKEKNKIAENTIRFIDEQIYGVLDSLNYTEQKLQDYRVDNKIINLTQEQILTANKYYDLIKIKAQENIKQKYYYSILDYIEKNIDVKDLFSPSSIGIEDPLLSSLILKLSQLSSEKIALSNISTKKNPEYTRLEQEINSYKNGIRENVFNTVNKSNIFLKDIDNQISALDKQVEKFPYTERNLVSIERKFKLNDAIYNYLLQKRADAGIAKESNTSNTIIIDNARYSHRTIIYPNKKIIYLITLLLGFLFPFIFLILSDVLSNKIVDISQIEKSSNIPIIGLVGESYKENELVVLNYPSFYISEAFRLVRTNLDYLTSLNKEKRVFIVTSGISGEGKTFSAVNVASVYALSGKKTIILGFDLRKPKLNKIFNLENEKGISNFLVGNADLDDLIRPTSHDLLDVLPSGPVPPNPGELIQSAKTTELFERLKQIYDIIIIDSPPVSFISDGLNLLNFVDVTIFIIRQNVSNKNVITFINNFKQNYNLKNCYILFNGFQYNNAYSYKSNYYYSTYYSYYLNEYDASHLLKKKGFFANLFKSKNKNRR